MSDSEYYFDEVASNNIIEFIERFTYHSRNEFYGKKFKLSSWQTEILRELFGWKRKEDNTRRYSRLYLEVPKGNGKSKLFSAICSFFLVNGSPNCRIYSCACDRKQARLIFDETAESIQVSPKLREVLTVQKSSIFCERTGASYQSLSRESGSQDGIIPNVICFSEAHRHKSSELYKVMRAGASKVTNSLFLMDTTAGTWEPESIYWQLHSHALKVLKDPSLDESLLVRIFAAPQEIEDPKTGKLRQLTWDECGDKQYWYMANPELGKAKPLRGMEDEYKEASTSPALKANWKRLHLNIIENGVSTFFDMDKWDKCSMDFDDEIENLLLENPCYVGCDFSMTTDLSAVVASWMVNDVLYSKCFFYAPEKKIRDSADNVPYLQWREDGYIDIHSGDTIDHRRIREDIKKLGETYHIQDLCYDPNLWNIMMDLQDEDGFSCVPIKQYPDNISPTLKYFQDLILKDRYRYQSNPVMRWNASNTVVEIDSRERIYPTKSKSTGRIDGISAQLCGLNRIMESDTGEFQYEAGDILL